MGSPPTRKRKSGRQRPCALPVLQKRFAGSGFPPDGAEAGGEGGRCSSEARQHAQGALSQLRYSVRLSVTRISAQQFFHRCSPEPLSVRIHSGVANPPSRRPSQRGTVAAAPMEVTFFAGDQTDTVMPRSADHHRRIGAAFQRQYAAETLPSQRPKNPSKPYSIPRAKHAQAKAAAIDRGSLGSGLCPGRHAPGLRKGENQGSSREKKGTSP